MDSKTTQKWLKNTTVSTPNDTVKSLNSIFNSKEYVFLIKTTQ